MNNLAKNNGQGNFIIENTVKVQWHSNLNVQTYELKTTQILSPKKETYESNKRFYDRLDKQIQIKSGKNRQVVLKKSA